MAGENNQTIEAKKEQRIRYDNACNRKATRGGLKYFNHVGRPAGSILMGASYVFLERCGAPIIPLYRWFSSAFDNPIELAASIVTIAVIYWAVTYLTSRVMLKFFRATDKLEKWTGYRLEEKRE